MVSRRYPAETDAVFKYILVPATGADTDAPVFSTALAVARQSGSHLVFLHVRIDVQQVLMAMATADMGGGVSYDRIIETLEEDVATRQKKAERAFHDFCEREQLAVSSDLTTHLPSAEWRTELGDEPTWLAEHGRTADLLVVGRAREGEPVAMDVLEACLMATGRPVLIAPARAPGRVLGNGRHRLEEPARGCQGCRGGTAIRGDGGQGGRLFGRRRWGNRRALLRKAAIRAFLA